jgi:hypothetical protein
MYEDGMRLSKQDCRLVEFHSMLTRAEDITNASVLAHVRRYQTDKFSKLIPLFRFQIRNVLYFQNGENKGWRTL